VGREAGGKVAPIQVRPPRIDPAKHPVEESWTTEKKCSREYQHLNPLAGGKFSAKEGGPSPTKQLWRHESVFALVRGGAHLPGVEPGLSRGAFNPHSATSSRAHANRLREPRHGAAACPTRSLGDASQQGCRDQLCLSCLLRKFISKKGVPFSPPFCSRISFQGFL
jgi:hypothetical protein